MAQKQGRVRFWFAGVVLVLLVAAASVVWYNVHRSETQQNLQQEVLSIGSQLRVPSEQDTMTVATSPDTMAQHMRYEIQQDLLKGQSRKQIMTGMVHEYGAEVLAAPAKRGFGGLVWTIPVVVLLLGLILLFIYFVRIKSVTKDSLRDQSLSKDTSYESHSDNDSVRIDDAIDKALRDYL